MIQGLDPPADLQPRTLSCERGQILSYFTQTQPPKIPPPSLLALCCLMKARWGITTVIPLGSARNHTTRIITTPRSVRAKGLGPMLTQARSCRASVVLYGLFVFRPRLWLVSGCSQRCEKNDTSHKSRSAVVEEGPPSSREPGTILEEIV